MSSFVFALLGTLFTFLMTALGAAAVFLMRRGVSARMQRLCLGFAGGVMSAAAVFSLLVPAREMADEAGMRAWLVLAGGFALGAAAIWLMDAVLEKFCHSAIPDRGSRGRLLLFSAITLHNIPEGMAVGVVLAGAMTESAGITMAGALALSLGIAIQNFPEGAIVSMPLKQSVKSRWKAFGYGVGSGIVEPIAGLITILLIDWLQPILPYLLAFSAGAMIYVVVEELIPEASAGEHSNVGTIAFALGFALMMVLDVALG